MRGLQGCSRKRERDEFVTEVEEGTLVIEQLPKLRRPCITFVLDKASLYKGIVGKTAKILNSEEHANFLRKQKKNPDDFRPDILYRSLLAIFDSPLRKAGMVQGIFVKINNGPLVEVKPHVRMPRTPKRFNGLMLELLQKSYTRAKDTQEKLLSMVEQPLTRHLPSNRRVIGLCHSSDKLVNLEDYVANVRDDVNLVFVVGAMPHGIIDKDYLDDFVSVSNYGRSSEHAIGDVCYALKEKWNIL